MATGGLLLLALALLAILYPWVLTVPLAILATWVAATLLIRALRLRAGHHLALPRDTSSQS